MLQVVGDVLLAGAVDQAMLVGSLVHAIGISAIARATILVVDNHLCVKTDGCVGVGQTVLDVEAVSKSRGCSL